MLLVPIGAWLVGWQWTGDENIIVPSVDYPLYFLTETGSVPYALITCVLLMLWLMWLARKRYSWLLVGAICAGSVLGTQVIKQVAKTGFAEPRPFVTQMMGEQSEQFYELPRSERAVLVKEYYKDSPYPLFAQHRADQTGYSFPSGHAMFSVSWLLVFGGLLLGLRGQAVVFAQIFVVIWSALMMISRLRLGMHYPVDLFTSTLITLVFHIVLFVWIVPYLETWKFFQKRGN
ncbi:phosphatase PAP2 family protein [Haemophilus paracuniculus]|nr:phosphatase PAP2 family protein [Haemophilus paracuniculus]